MEDQWRLRKCSSILHLTTASAPLQWRSMVSNGGNHIYPHVSHDPPSFALGMQQDSSLKYFLSRSSSQSDSRLLLNPNSILTSNKGPMMSLTSGNVSARQPSQHLNSYISSDGASIYSFSSNPTLCFMSSGNSGPNDMLQAVGVNPQKPEFGTQNLTSCFALREKLEDSYVPRRSQIAVPVANNVMEFNNTTNTGTPANVCTLPRFSSHQLSSLSISCPRVFCLGLSGYLLVSNTGLLGIVCACHGLHMSVSKFSEHSGLNHVNPGSAVQVNRSETIAQWRKAFFQRLGAMAPEDDSGWEWPEGFSELVSSEKYSVYVPSLSVSSKPPNRFGACGQSLNNVMLSKNPYPYHNAVDKQFHSVKQRNSLENIFTGVICTSQGVLNPMLDYKTSGCSTMSNFDGKRGPYSSAQATSAFISSSSNSANTLMSVPDMQNFKSSTVGGVEWEKVSSNIELRHGQPSQWSWTLGTSSPSAIRCNQSSAHVVPQKSPCPGPLISESSDSRIIEERRPVHLASHSEQFKDNTPGASVFPMSYLQFRGCTEENQYSKSSYDLFNGSHTLSRELPCESLITDREKPRLPSVRGDAMEKGHNVYFMDYLGHGKNNGGSGNMITDLRWTSEFKGSQHINLNENQASFNGDMCRIGHRNGSAFHDQNPFMCLDGRRQVFNYSNKISSVANNGDCYHVSLDTTEADAAADTPHCCHISDEDLVVLKETVSSISSGCSVPMVTQMSITIPNKEMSTVDAEDAHRARSVEVDDGSEIDRCWSSDDSIGCERSAELSESASIKQMIHEPYSADSDSIAMRSSLNCPETSDLDELFCKQLNKPVVWDKYGIICNGNQSKPIKIVRLRDICDRMRKNCSTGKQKTKITRMEYQKNGIKGRDKCFNKCSNVKKVARFYPDQFSASKYCEDCHEFSGGLDPCCSMEQTGKGYFNEGDASVSLPYSLRKRSYNFLGNNAYVSDASQAQKKQKCKEILKQSNYELAIKESIHLAENDSTCARAEGYKGCKKDGVFYNPHSGRKRGCLVPQEQLNAWFHINGLKSCTKRPPRLPMKDSEYDYRKEYAHYKQSKGWKGLVVYKSGIHGLGLYSSHFISRSTLVVEYIGEVVGPRVADKRENEYLSGKKLQYKSACYFFRIDKEHIIDATRKGGIARFVNHSCQPNCVARVISVRNEKKVVFFAERDIYPGEEITYDYHFNHEDEGKKLPCYCNSKNCRRYMN